MTEIKQDIFEYLLYKNTEEPVVIPHVCNNMRGFKRGFALEVRKKYPIVAEKYDSLFHNN